MDTTPQSNGFRWPAEWEPHHATWLAWPHNPETWPGQLEAVVASYVEMAGALHARERVCITVLDAAMEETARRCLSQAGIERGLEFHRFPTNDAWIRDHGPVFVKKASQVAVVDFRFDSWGRKYPPWDLDDRIPRAIAGARRIRCFGVDVVLEGGSVDGNGCGSVLTTESCLLNPNRGPSRTREDLELLLHDTLGATNVLWLAGGIEGDDTDGHVDDFCRFVDPGTVVAAEEEDPQDPNHAPLAENLRRLRGMRDQDGKPLAVATLPMPPPLRFGGLRCHASYANFYLANGVALVPVFEARSDARALAVLRELLPGREVVPIQARELVVGLGAVHCLTQQEPAHEQPQGRGQASVP